MEVPTATSLRDIYPEDSIPVQQKRWESLLAKFKEIYGKQPDFVSRSPGRVNIIGEVKQRHVNFSFITQLKAHSTSITLSMKSSQWQSRPTLSWLWPCDLLRSSHAYG